MFRVWLPRPSIAVSPLALKHPNLIPWLFCGPLLSRKTVFGPFSWLFRGFFVAFS